MRPRISKRGSVRQCIRVCLCPLAFQISRRKRRFEPEKLFFSYIHSFHIYPDLLVIFFTLREGHSVALLFFVSSVTVDSILYPKSANPRKKRSSCSMHSIYWSFLTFFSDVVTMSMIVALFLCLFCLFFMNYDSTLPPVRCEGGREIEREKDVNGGRQWLCPFCSRNPGHI